MKLYTEFEIKFAMDVARCQPDKTFDEVLEELTPIELPSDEEIEEYFKHGWGSDNHGSYAIFGAKWMLDKIGGNNES
jgi:predicted house-cleaning NTP pyrophosphatase (Maf/HAM1 superfamily)